MWVCEKRQCGSHVALRFKRAHSVRVWSVASQVHYHKSISMRSAQDLSGRQQTPCSLFLDRILARILHSSSGVRLDCTATSYY